MRATFQLVPLGAAAGGVVVGTLSGAAIGAAAGGPIGAGVGAAVGAVVGGTVAGSAGVVATNKTIQKGAMQLVAKKKVYAPRLSLQCLR